VKRWKTMQEEWRVEVTKHMGGKSKRLYTNDGLKRVKDVLQEFYNLNHNMPKDLKLPITLSIITSLAVLILPQMSC
jgi:hypothetical protein